MANQDNREIERKWVLDKLPENMMGPCVQINQGYLRVKGLKKCQLRLRKCQKEDGSIEYKLAFKKGEGLTRLEWERDLPEEVFLSLRKGVKWSLKKMRYRVTIGKNILEIDVYLSNSRLAGLIILECEFLSEESAAEFVLPDWLDVKLEVTDDVRYSNFNLARHGRPC